MRTIALICLLALAPFAVSAQVDSTRDAHRLKVIALPGVFSSPETSLGFGVIGIGTFRLPQEGAETRTSQVSVGVSYTLLNQFLFYLPYQLYWKQERWKSYGELGWYKYFYRYYGIGPGHGAEGEENYDVRYPRIRLNLMRRVGKSVSLGGGYVFDNFNITHFDSTGVLQQHLITGTEGGIISGVGPVVNVDTRDNIFEPYHGILAEASVLAFTSALGSDFGYGQASLEVSGFIPLARPKPNAHGYRLMRPVLALNVLATGISGDAPFYALGLLGGTRHMRGYYEGYFRDNIMVQGQAELRMPLFPERTGLRQRLGVTAFAGSGTVAPRVDALAVDDVVFTAGGGLRVLLDRKQGINLRVDYAVGRDVSGFYLTIGEAF